MASATLISVSEYLATTYRPDCDLVDGRLVERNLGEYDHSRLQMTIAAWFYARERAWNIRVLPEQRVQVIPSRFRVPDVCVISRDQPIEQIITHPPHICIEVLSKDDTLRSLQDRVDDYINFGVPHVWALDPVSRRAYVCTRAGFSEPQSGVLRVDDTPIEIRLADVFGSTDRAWNIRVLPEQRVQVIASRFRVPDVCVISRERPIEQIITHPPVICIEVLSKDDTLRSLQDRIDDYLNFGVPNIWTLDPVSRRAYVCTRAGLSEPQDGILRVAGTPIEINLAELFADLD